MKTIAPLPRTERKQGFTLIEILVALSVTALMVTLMVNITIGVLNVWNRSSGTLTTGNQARTLMDQIAQDLQGAIFKRDGNVWLAATVQKDQTIKKGDANMDTADWTTGKVKPVSGGATDSSSLDLAAVRPSLGDDMNKLENVRFGQAGVWLRFITNVSDTNEAGKLYKISAPRAVSYQICRVRIGSPTKSDQIGYMLYRSEVNPDLTFNNGYDLISDVYEKTGSIDDGFPATIRTPRKDRLMANNVIDFGVRFLEKIRSLNSDGTERWDILERFPAIRKIDGTVLTANPISPYLVTSNSAITYPSTYGATGTPTTGFPVVAEIMVRILTQEGVNKLQAFESNKISAPPGTSDADYWWAIAEQNSNVFIRRVEIKSTAL